MIYLLDTGFGIMLFIAAVVVLTIVTEFWEVISAVLLVVAALAVAIIWCAAVIWSLHGIGEAVLQIAAQYA